MSAREAAAATRGCGVAACSGQQQQAGSYCKPARAERLPQWLAAAAAANPGPGAPPRGCCSVGVHGGAVRCAGWARAGEGSAIWALATMPRWFTQTGANWGAPLPFCAACATTGRAPSWGRARRTVGRSGSTLRAPSAAGAWPLNPRLCMAARDRSRAPRTLQFFGGWAGSTASRPEKLGTFDYLN